MTKFKSWVITAVAGLLLFCVLYLSNSYDIRCYRTLQAIFAVFGETMALYVFYKWLREPSVEVDPKHVDITVRSGNTIPNGWLNPFKTVKEEKKNGQNMAKADGLSNAGDSTNRTVTVSSRPVDSGRPGDGDCEVDSIFAYGTAPRKPESASIN